MRASLDRQKIICRWKNWCLKGVSDSRIYRDKRIYWKLSVSVFYFFFFIIFFIFYFLKVASSFRRSLKKQITKGCIERSWIKVLTFSCNFVKLLQCSGVIFNHIQGWAKSLLCRRANYWLVTKKALSPNYWGHNIFSRF